MYYSDNEIPEAIQNYVDAWFDYQDNVLPEDLEVEDLLERWIADNYFVK